MIDHLSSLETIRDIKKMMERSSRFISLSGWSGIAAGSCALVGAWLAHRELLSHNLATINDNSGYISDEVSRPGRLLSDITAFTSVVGRLLWIAIFTFIAAFILAFLFTWARSKKQGLPLWGNTSLRLMTNVMIPMIAGGFLLIRALQFGYWEIVAPGCLIFYGLALVNGSKYTLGEVRYLGYIMLILGIVNLWFFHYGLYFWAAGFGIMHILYGFLMWWKYERG